MLKYAPDKCIRPLFSFSSWQRTRSLGMTCCFIPCLIVRQFMFLLYKGTKCTMHPCTILQVYDDISFIFVHFFYQITGQQTSWVWCNWLYVDGVQQKETKWPTLQSGISIRVRLLIFEVFSRGYSLIKGGYVYWFWFFKKLFKEFLTFFSFGYV